MATAATMSELGYNPSLKTVEITSDAKIYFETHFNNLLANPNARSLRRRAMEHRLNKTTTEHEKRLNRETWRQNESEYLRETRTNRMAIGDFEVIKVIGKGVFGCVKLVKMKEQVATKEPSSQKMLAGNSESRNSR